jgi:hypothetical protein
MFASPSCVHDYGGGLADCRQTFFYYDTVLTDGHETLFSTRVYELMATKILFARRYRAALLDYLLGGRETGLSRAYELGRSAVNEGLGLLEILRAHQKAVNAVLESTGNGSESLRRLKASESFLMETLSPFEMTYRGYVELLEGGHKARDRATDRRGARRHG